MAQIVSSFQCRLCGERLAFPQDSDITDFTILLLQFYKAHDQCIAIQDAKNVAMKKAAQSMIKSKKKKK